MMAPSGLPDALLRCAGLRGEGMARDASGRVGFVGPCFAELYVEEQVGLPGNPDIVSIANAVSPSPLSD